jgi:hypothetical protein
VSDKSSGRDMGRQLRKSAHLVVEDCAALPRNMAVAAAVAKPQCAVRTVEAVEQTAGGNMPRVL